MAIYPPPAVQEAARWGLEQRAVHQRGGTAKAVGIAHLLANGLPLDEEVADYVEATLATTFMDDGFFPGEPGYPSSDRIMASLVGGQVGWTGAKLKAAAEEQPFEPAPEQLSAADRKALTKRLVAIQQTVAAELTALGEAALTVELERLRPTLPDYNAQLAAAVSTGDVLLAVAGAFVGLKTLAARRIANARTDIVEEIARYTGLSKAEALRRLQEFDAANGFTAKQWKPGGAAQVAAEHYVARLREQANSIIIDPQSPTGLTSPDGNLDVVSAGPFTAARESLAVAGGVTPPPVDADLATRRNWLYAIGAGILGGQLLRAVTRRRQETREAIADNLTRRRKKDEGGGDETQTRELAVNDEAFQWVWGPGLIRGGTYEPHYNRDGVVYSGPEDPRLSTEGDPFLSTIAEFDYPSIFSTCGCTKVPVFDLADVNVSVAASSWTKPSPWRITAASKHAASAMVALRLPPDVANQVAVEGGEAPEKMHVTVVYLGDIAELDQDRILKALGEVRSEPLAGSIGGIGRFAGSHKEGLDAVWCPVDVPGLSELHVKVMQALIHSGLDSASTHGFTAHVTLKYVGSEEPTPMPVSNTPVAWDGMTLYWGDERVEFPFVAISPAEEEIQSSGWAEDAVPRRRRRKETPAAS